MRDYIGAAAEDLYLIESNARKVFSAAGFREIRTPVLEDAVLFDRSLGSGSDVVSKEMYTVDQGSEDRLIALRPENTAGVVRSLNENDLLANRNQLKLFYFGAMFRHEKPQSGRLRQFHQSGLEVFGRDDPLCDAEVVALGQDFLDSCGIKNTKLLLNSIGCEKCRPPYLEKLKAALQPISSRLCEDCQRRLDTNPLRVLDCKNESCRELMDGTVPLLVDNLCEGCLSHYNSLKTYLARMDIDFVEDPLLVRGLDYYTKTTFEFVSEDLGSQDAVLAGGRYDGLIEQLGGDPAPAIGFSAGIERMMILRGTYREENVEINTDIYFASLNEDCMQGLLGLLRDYRATDHPVKNRKIKVELGRPAKSIKSQLRRANRYNARLVLIYGDREKKENKIAVKDMLSGEQETIDFPPSARLVEMLADTYDQERSNT
jgi:histidyl-tRNA synthetase